MSYSAWHVTDLSAIAAWLRSTKRHRRLVGMIDRAAAAGTIREDLREAQRCLGEIERIQAGREGPESARSRMAKSGGLQTDRFRTFSGAKTTLGCIGFTHRGSVWIPTISRMMQSL